MKIGDEVVKNFNSGMVYGKVGGKVCEILLDSYKVDFGYFGIQEFNKKVIFQSKNDFVKKCEERANKTKIIKRDIILGIGFLVVILLVIGVMILCYI